MLKRLCVGLVCSAVFVGFAQGQENLAAPSADALEQAEQPKQNELVSVPTWTLQVDAPKSLQTLLMTFLDLGKGQASSEEELRRLIAAAPDQAIDLLQTQGYFDAQVKVRIVPAQGNLAQIIKMVVEPGPQATVEKVQILYEGDLDSRLSDDDASAQALAEKLFKQWPVSVGQVFTQDRWSQAKSATLAYLRANGYPLATWSGTSATVDAQAHTTRLFLVADSGPALTYGALQVDGLQKQPLSAVENLMPFSVGQSYQEKQLLDYQDRIQKLNLFESVFVSLGEIDEDTRQAPVNVQVRELPLQQATFGVGVSSDAGPRVSVEHTNRLLLGLPWQSKSKLQLGSVESLVQSDLTSHPRADGTRRLLSVQTARKVSSEDAITLSGRLRVGYTYESERNERTTYLEWQRALVTSAGDNAVSGASAVSYMQQWLRRDLDSLVLPTRGYSINAYAGVGRSFAGLQESGWFMRAYARLTGYLPLPLGWYGSARTEAGQVFSNASVSLPDTMLYRAGGDDSVRGYDYQSLGTKTGGVTLGGRSLWTSSFELARPISSSYPAFWGAFFVDVGDAAAAWSDLDPKVGYGVGMRWRSPVGPLRLDVAYGQDVRDYRLHFSVGVSF